MNQAAPSLPFEHARSLRRPYRDLHHMRYVLKDMRWGEIRDLSDHSAPSPFPPRFFSWISRPTGLDSMSMLFARPLQRQDLLRHCNVLRKEVEVKSLRGLEKCVRGELSARKRPKSCKGRLHKPTHHLRGTRDHGPRIPLAETPTPHTPGRHDHIHTCVCACVYVHVYVCACVCVCVKTIRRPPRCGEGGFETH